MTYSLFTGCSFVLDDVATVRDIAQLVKHIWPNDQRTVDTPLDAGLDGLRRRTDGTISGGMGVPAMTGKRQAANDTWSTHVMTQVDRLRAEGITGSTYTCSFARFLVQQNS